MTIDNVDERNCDVLTECDWDDVADERSFDTVNEVCPLSDLDTEAVESERETVDLASSGLRGDVNNTWGAHRASRGTPTDLHEQLHALLAATVDEDALTVFGAKQSTSRSHTSGVEQFV